MTDLQKLANKILEGAIKLEKIAADPNGAPRNAIRGIYRGYKKTLIKHFNDYLQGTGLSDDEYNAIAKGQTEVRANVAAKKTGSRYVVSVKISAVPVAALGTKSTHFNAAKKLGKYLNSKEGSNMSKDASVAASKWTKDPDTSSFSFSDVMFTVP